MTNTTISPLAEDLERRVHEAVASIAAEPGERVSVCVKGTCAVLKGAVRSWAEHEDAERAALSIPGVTTVDNQLALLVKAKLATS